MVISLPAGLLADRVSKRSVIVAMKVYELVLMLAGTAVLFVEPQGGPLAMGVLALLGVQLALFSPAKYGILPEILPHERLSAGNGLLEMGSNLAILCGIVAGGVIISAAKQFQVPLWYGGVLLTTFAACGLLAALTIPRVKAARSEGGMITTLRIAWESIRADRVLKLTLIGQVLVWAIASLVPAPILPYASKVLGLPEWQTGLPLAALGIGIGVGCVLAGKLSGAKVEYGLLPLGALGLTVTTLAFAVIGPGPDGTMIIMTLLGIFSGFLFVPLNALLQWRSPRRPPGCDHRVRERAGVCRDVAGLGAGAGAGPGRGPAPGHVPGRRDRAAGRLLLGDDAGPRRLLPVHPDRTGPHALSRAGPGPVECAQRGRRAARAQSRLVRRRPLPDRQHRSADPVRGLRHLLRAAAPGLVPAVDEGDPDLAERRPQE